MPPVGNPLLNLLFAARNDTASDRSAPANPDVAIGLHDGFGYWQAVIPGPLGVNPETPFGTVVSVSWPKDGGTYIIEVVGTGYFSVSIG